MHGRSWRCDSRTNIFKKCDMSHQYFDWTNIDLGFNFGACFRTSDDRKMLHQYVRWLATVFNLISSERQLSKWAATWQNQQSDCAASEDSDQTTYWVYSETLIRLGGCPGWSESSLGAQSLCLFCHPVWNAPPGNLASFCKLSRRQRHYF